MGRLSRGQATSPRKSLDRQCPARRSRVRKVSSFLLISVFFLLLVAIQSKLSALVLEDGPSKLQGPRAEIPIDDAVIAGQVWRSYGKRCIEEAESGPQWERRAPYFLLIGAMKAGTEALVYYLRQHPSVVRTRPSEMHFLNKRSHLFMSRDGIHRARGRLLYQAAFRDSIAPAQARRLQRNESLVALDKTPSYLYQTTLAPAAMCLAPWVKLVAVVRNPVDRLVSHFHHTHRKRHKAGQPAVEWETWIRHDLGLLRRAGVVRDWASEADFRQFAGSTDEAEAWEQYVTSHTTQALVGKGLYAIQLRRWMAAMDEIGKPRSDLMVLQSELLRNHTQEEYSRLLVFLRLPDHQLKDTSIRHTSSQSDAPPMPAHLRKELEEFFRPYNQQLRDLLGIDVMWE